MKINVSTVYLYLPAKTSKWTKVDAFLVPFIYFLLFFSYTPIYLLLCNYPFFPKHPLLSAIMRFFTFLTPFLHFFAPFHIHTIKNDPSNLPSRREQITPKNHSPARTRGHTRPPLTSVIFFVLTCEKDSSVSEKARIFMPAFERLKKAQDPVIRRSLSRL